MTPLPAALYTPIESTLMWGVNGEIHAKTSTPRLQGRNALWIRLAGVRHEFRGSHTRGQKRDWYNAPCKLEARLLLFRGIRPARF